MSPLTSPKGPLPSRVYWFRRAMVLSIVFLLVFGTARLFGGGDDGDTPKATTVGAITQAKDAAVAKPKDEAEDAEDAKGEPTAQPSPSAKPTPTPTPTETPKPEPTGACDPADVVVTPSVPKLRTTLRVTVNLTFTTRETPACTFTVSPKTVAVKIDSGARSNPDVIWQSQQCVDAIPTRDVVVYKDHATTVPMKWSGRRSDAECSRQTSWAKAGWYHAQGAAYGGEPTDVQFELTRLSPVTVTKTVAPKQQPTKKTPAGGAAKPDGAVEPDATR